jgi:cytochrome c553
VLHDRLGNLIEPALKTATHRSEATAAQIVDLSHFLHQRVEATARNRNPTAPLNVLTGDPEAGREYFNGAGMCSTCHSPTGDLADLARRVTDPVNLQQRFLFPTLRRDGARRVEVTVTPAAGPSISGTLVRMDDFSVSLRDSSGEYHSFTRVPGTAVSVRDPLVVHHELLDRYTDTNMHDITAYLSTLK